MKRNRRLLDRAALDLAEAYGLYVDAWLDRRPRTDLAHKAAAAKRLLLQRINRSSDDLLTAPAARAAGDF